jgi:hypothetical protein
MRSLFNTWYRRFGHWFVGKSRQGKNAWARNRSRRVCLSFDQLEDRMAPAVYFVNTLADISFTASQVDPATGEIMGHGNTVTLRSAIEAANETPGSNTIELLLPGDYKIAIPPAAPDDTAATENNLTGDFDIIPNAASPAHSSLTIVNASGDTAMVDGNNLDRVFDINPGGGAVPAGFTVILKGFTIQNGFASSGDGPSATGGGIRDEGNVNLTLTNMVVKNNRSTADGGGIVMENTVNASWILTIMNSTISNNHAGDAGGGIDTDGHGTVMISNSVVSGNTDLNQGAGIYIDSVTDAQGVLESANMTMTKTIVTNNSALAPSTTDGQGGSGGGISNAGNGTIRIDSSTISSNFADGSGGGFDDENGFGTLDIQQSLFINNSAALDGGAIREGGPSTFINSSEIKDNSSGGAGGGIFANGVTLTLQTSTVAGNTSSSNGGGIELQTTGSGTSGSTITDVTIAGNSALNNAGVNGGGIDAPAGFTGSVSLLNDTINANVAANGGGVFWVETSGTFAVQNTIIAQNFATTGPDAHNPSGNFTDNGNNLIGIAGATGGNTGFNAGSDQNGTASAPLDPKLGPLGNNGGPTVGAPGSSMVLETEKPAKGSPAIGNGNPAAAPMFDERGFLSVTKGKANIGAVSQAKHE